MKNPVLYSCFALSVILALSSCQSSVTVPCEVEGPLSLLPATVDGVHLGMTQMQLEQRMGAADYSPAAGIFYFSTGGDCPVETGAVETETNVRLASCGLVADFSDHQTGELRHRLQSCRWGAIAE